MEQRPEDQEHEYLIKVRSLSKVGRRVGGGSAAAADASAAAAGSSDKLIRTAEYLSKMENDPLTSSYKQLRFIQKLRGLRTTQPRLVYAPSD